MGEETHEYELRERETRRGELLRAPLGEGDAADAMTKATSVIDFMKEATGVDLAAEVAARGELRPPGVSS